MSFSDSPINYTQNKYRDRTNFSFLSSLYFLHSIIYQKVVSRTKSERNCERCVFVTFTLVWLVRFGSKETGKIQKGDEVSWMRGNIERSEREEREERWAKSNNDKCWLRQLPTPTLWFRWFCSPSHPSYSPSSFYHLYPPFISIIMMNVTKKAGCKYHLDEYIYSIILFALFYAKNGKEKGCNEKNGSIWIDRDIDSFFFFSPPLPAAYDFLTSHLLSSCFVLHLYFHFCCPGRIMSTSIRLPFLGIVRVVLKYIL